MCLCFDVFMLRWRDRDGLRNYTFGLIGPFLSDEGLVGLALLDFVLSVQLRVALKICGLIVRLHKRIISHLLSKVRNRLNIHSFRVAVQILSIAGLFNLHLHVGGCLMCSFLFYACIFGDFGLAFVVKGYFLRELKN